MLPGALQHGGRDLDVEAVAAFTVPVVRVWLSGGMKYQRRGLSHPRARPVNLGRGAVDDGIEEGILVRVGRDSLVRGIDGFREQKAGELASPPRLAIE